MAKYIIIAVIGVLVISAIQPKYIRIKGHSMYPTLRNGGVYRVKPKPFARDFGRGDIVAVYVRGVISYTKRIIAVGGDRLRVTRTGTVYINGDRLQEPYVLPQNRGGRAVDMVVPDGCYFVMGDNRTHSSDSRDFGVLEKWQILGKIILEERGKCQQK